MSSRNQDKNKEVIKDLEKKISPVLVINNASLKPYVELFEYAPENIYQQALGNLVGFFEIKEYSQDSAYIVNFLTSVLKKEYYMNPKRPVNESFDSALHKVNLALSEIVKNGNVEWLGKLNAAICVLEKNNAHFSVAGSAKIFLYRNSVLSDISEDLASNQAEPHPLKTFVNVSSGRLEKDDRMLITSEDIFQILPLQEIKKSFYRLEGEKFVQFLRTALSNQMEMITAIVVEIKEENQASAIKTISLGKNLSKIGNVFSGTTFTENPEPQQKKEEKILSADKEESEAVEEPDYTDKKTKHIYVRGETDNSSESSQAKLYWEIFKEKFAQNWYSAKNNLNQRASLYRRKLVKKRELMRVEKEKRREEKEIQTKLAAEEKEKRLEEKRIEKQIMEQEKERMKQVAEEEKMIREMKSAEEMEEKQQPEIEIRSEKEQLTLQEENPQEQPSIGIIDKIERLYNRSAIVKKEEKTPDIGHQLSFREKLQMAISEIQKKKNIDLKKSEDEPEEIIIIEETEELTDLAMESPAGAKKNFLSKMMEIFRKISKAVMNFKEKLSGKVFSPTFRINRKKASFLVPRFSKIGSMFHSFTRPQKFSVIFALIAIFIIPLFIVRWMNNRPQKQESNQVQLTAEPTMSEKLAGEKNIDLSPQKKILLARNDMLSAIQTGQGLLIATKKGAAMISPDGEQKEYALPESSGKIIKTAFMKDLSLMFMLDDSGKMFSFSPVSTKFSEEKINLLEKSSGILLGTYMTYIYTVNPESGKIFRYPRASVPGGFGEGKSWLKEEVDLSKVTDLAIDDNIYCADKDDVLKLFKNKRAEINLEPSKTPVSFDSIYTSAESSSLYILDKKNSRLIVFDKENGTINRQYFDESLGEGISIYINEEKKEAIITTEKDLVSISL
jgi:hypothetical protein